MDSIVYRIFGSSSCDDCSKLKKAMDFYGFYYDFIDVDADQNEKLCDKFNIDKIPHIQALSQKTGDVHVQYIGYISPIAFFNLLSDKAEFGDSNMIINGVSESNGNNSKKQSGCGCGKRTKKAKNETKPATGSSSES